MSDIPQSNPWKGLNTYVEGEVLYGRDEEIAQLTAQVTRSTQTVLYGRSGIGKSSIINAGIFPLVRHEGYFPVSIRLEHNAESYTQQVHRAVTAALNDLRPGREGGPVRGRAEELVPLHTTEEKESLWEFFHRFRYFDHQGRPIRPLVVIDQFEEIFTLASERKAVDGFFRQLADLLNGIMPDELIPDAPEASETDPNDLFSGLTEQMATQAYLSTPEFSLVFVLREDFLSYLERATAFIPPLKNNRFSLRPINDEQAAAVIMQPRPGLVPIDVAEFIIQRIASDDTVHIDGVPEVEIDSAILSLYLSRLYDKMLQQHLDAFTLELVETYSSNIISDFYEESTRGLSYSALRFLEEELINKEGRRDNRDRLTVMERTGLSASQLEHLVRDVKLLRQFSYGGTLRIEFIHDILCPTIVAHREKRAMQRATRRTRRRLWWGFTGVLTLMLVVGLYFTFDWWENSRISSECYLHFERRNGWPVGIGEPLSHSERQTTPLYYRLSKQGHGAPHFTRVEVCSSNALLPDEPHLDCLEVNPSTDASPHATADASARSFATMLTQVASIDFTASGDGLIEKEVVRNTQGRPLLIVSYFHQQTASGSNNHEAWQTFLTPEGQSLKVRDNQLDRAKVVWDSLGRLSAITWYDDQGVTCAAADSAFGYRFAYSATGDTVIRRALDDCGLLLQPSRGWNTLVTVHNARRTDHFYARLFNDADASEWRQYLVNAFKGCAHTIDDGKGSTLFYRATGATENFVARTDRTADSRGNVTEEVVHTAPTPFASDFLRQHPARTRSQYDPSSGRLTSRVRLNGKGQPFVPTDSAIHQESWKYAADGRLLDYKALSKRGVESFTHRLFDKDNRLTEESSSTYGEAYFGATYHYDGRRIIISYHDAKSAPCNTAVRVGSLTFPICRMEIDSTDRRTTRRFYALDTNGQSQPLAVSFDPYGAAISFFRLTNTYDAEGNKLTSQAFDTKGDIVRSMRYYYQDGECIARSAMGLDGKAVRCPLWEEERYAYYKMYFTRNFNEQFNALKAVNEWERPSVFYDEFLHTAQQVNYVNLKGQELKSAVINVNFFTYQLVETKNDVTRSLVPFLHFHQLHRELHDRYHLADGDRIIRLGTWQLGDSKEAFLAQWGHLMEGRPLSLSVVRPIVGTNREVFKLITLTDVRLKPSTEATGDVHLLPLTFEEARVMKGYVAGR